MVSNKKLTHLSALLLVYVRMACVHAGSVLQSCSTLCNPIDCSPPGSSVRGILEAGILEWVAMSFSRGSSWYRDRTHVSCLSCVGRWILFISWATWETQEGIYVLNIQDSAVRIDKLIYTYIYIYICVASIHLFEPWFFVLGLFLS